MEITQEPTLAQVAEKASLDRSCQTQGALVGYGADYAKEMEKEREAQRVRHTRDVRLNIFAEILRARADLSPEQAAEATTKVYATLCG